MNKKFVVISVVIGGIATCIGENGSGKSTTQKLICGHLVPDGGEIKLFGKSYTDAGVRIRVGALIENTGCFPGSSVWDNLMMQAINLGLKNPNEDIDRVLHIVRMEDSAKLKFKKCSLGMKQRMLSAGGKIAFEVLQSFSDTKYVSSFIKALAPYGLLSATEITAFTTGSDKSFITASHMAERYYIKTEI